MPCLGCLMGKAYQKLTSGLEQALAAKGVHLTSAEYMLLRALYTRDGLQQCEICNMVAKDKGSVSRTVSAMSRRGLLRVERESHKCSRIWLTESGEALRDGVMEVAAERHAGLEALAPPSDIEAMSRVLEIIAKQ